MRRYHSHVVTSAVCRKRVLISLLLEHEIEYDYDFRFSNQPHFHSHRSFTLLTSRGGGTRNKIAATRDDLKACALSLKSRSSIQSRTRT